ncbi:MAG TPA: class I lanthipeptide [Thermoanaerobaculia bacterium]|nr:class I lanthipeptide [Thermoanaerobaculia bacterium]
MNKKKITKRIELNKETLRNLSERDLQAAAGGVSQLGTCRSDCYCISADGSCPPTWPGC